MDLSLRRRSTATSTAPASSSTAATPEPVDTATSLPSGHDVPDSPFYVPDDLRPYYRVDRAAESKEWEAGFGDAVWPPKQQMGKHKLRTDADYVESLRRRGIVPRDTDPATLPWVRLEHTVLAELTEVDREKWFHGQRLRSAREALNLAQAAADAQRRTRGYQTDQVTGAYPVNARRETVGSTVVVATSETLEVLRLYRVMRLADRQLPDGRTLGQAVEEFLDKNPGV